MFSPRVQGFQILGDLSRLGYHIARWRRQVKGGDSRGEASSLDEPVYQFMNKKRSEGKPYRVYMMASANKFLRIYYASVKAYLDSLEHD